MSFSGALKVDEVQMAKRARRVKVCALKMLLDFFYENITRFSNVGVNFLLLLYHVV